MVEKNYDFKVVEIATDSRIAIVDKDNNEYSVAQFLVLIKKDLDEIKRSVL